MKRKRAALFNPYLDVLGGGEKYILSILKVLEDEGYMLDIFWDTNLQKEFKVKFNLSFNYLINFVPNLFDDKFGFLNKLIKLKKYEYFFHVTDGSYFFSRAKNNFIYAMVPQSALYKMTALNKFKLSNYKFITHSQFTQKYLTVLGIESSLIYPYLAQEFILAQPESFKKEKIILSVGRFFKHLHAKNQDKIINAFQALKKNGGTFQNYKLILAGGLKQEDMPYLESLKKLASDDRSIVFKPNVSFYELHELYKKSEFYWHFAGYGVDENAHPEEVEHLGITPLEAMAMGCMTFCVSAGGPKELIQNGKTGFLFKTESELATKMNNIVGKKQSQTKVRRLAKDFILEKFTFPKFRERVKEIIL